MKDNNLTRFRISVKCCGATHSTVTSGNIVPSLFCCMQSGSARPSLFTARIVLNHLCFLIHLLRLHSNISFQVHIRPKELQGDHIYINTERYSLLRVPSTVAPANTHANVFFVFLPGGISKECRHIVSANGTLRGKHCRYRTNVFGPFGKPCETANRTRES